MTCLLPKLIFGPFWLIFDLKHAHFFFQFIRVNHLLAKYGLQKVVALLRIRGSFSGKVSPGWECGFEENQSSLRRERQLASCQPGPAFGPAHHALALRCAPPEVALLEPERPLVSATLSQPI